MYDNVMYDVMLAGATASLIAASHSGVVRDNFETFYDLLASSFDDVEFLDKLVKLKPGGQVTRGIRLTPENDAVCFASRLWFKVRKSSSRWWEGYYVGIGISLKDSDMNVTGIRKLEISRLAVGGIDEIREKIKADCFREDCLERLTEHAYSSCYEAVSGFMTDIPASEVKESHVSAEKEIPSWLEIDFGTAHSQSVTFVWKEEDKT